MNKEIKKRLIKEATKRVDVGPEGLGGSYYEDELSPGKLIKLVVNECIRLLERDIIRNGPTPENKRTNLHIETIRKHFGIEDEH